MGQGKYAHDGLYELPPDWEVVSDAVLDLAMSQTRRALGIVAWGGTGSTELVPAEYEAAAQTRLASYFNPAGHFSGWLFSKLGESSSNDIAASDLLAVTTLAMQLDAIVVRQIMEVGGKRSDVLSLLSKVSDGARLDELDRANIDAASTSRLLKSSTSRSAKHPPKVPTSGSSHRSSQQGSDHS